MAILAAHECSSPLAQPGNRVDTRVSQEVSKWLVSGL